MQLNEAMIPHYRAKMVPIEKLKKQVELNEAYLKEKPTWYNIDNQLQYFKIRNDFRLFTEQFFSMFGREIMGLDTLDYRVAYVRTILPVKNTHEEETKCGLLSDCFQSPVYNYYLVSEMMSAEISDLVRYGGYSLQTLLAFFKDYLANDDYQENELFLIKLFISDAFTHQEDRNYHNIGFKIPKIKGVKYTERLRPERLERHRNKKEYLAINSQGLPGLKGLSPTKVYDNERMLGTDHKNVFTYTPGQIWCPLFPYSQETLFESQDKAVEASKSIDGLDPNLFSIYCDYLEICTPIFERLAYDDEYRRILERFQGSNMQINLSQKSIDRITEIFEDKRKVFQKILKY